MKRLFVSQKDYIFIKIVRKLFLWQLKNIEMTNLVQTTSENSAKSQKFRN